VNDTSISNSRDQSNIEEDHIDPIQEDGVDQQESEEEEALNPQIQPFNKLPKEQMVIDFTDE
jgi:hypothetical protein